MSKPYIEFHFAIKDPHGYVFEHHVLRPSDWTFEMVKDEDWSLQQGEFIVLLGLRWQKWMWPGGYPMFYMTKDGSVLSPDSANEQIDRTLDPDDEQFYIVAMDANYEDPRMYCDHSGERIPSAYAEDQVQDVKENS